MEKKYRIHQALPEGFLNVQVFCDRHYGGINYPVGGVGRIGEELAAGLQERGSHIEYKANVRKPTPFELSRFMHQSRKHA